VSVARRSFGKPRKCATQERSRATVAALIEATARILVSEGFDRASTNRVADLAGVSVGSLYQYFPNKEALVLAVIEQHHRDIMRVVGNALTEIVSLSLEEAVRRIVTAAIEAHRVDPELHRVLAEQIPHAGPLDEVDSVKRGAEALFCAYLEGSATELRVRDVRLAAFVCATSVEAVAHNAVLHHPEMRSRAAISALVDETTRLIVGYLKRA
jgi:AcrR family transcriptional regulator